MRFPITYVKAVKADIVKNEITISLTLTLEPENLEIAQELSNYCGDDAGAVVTEITPRQMAFKTKT